jgi:F-type H+-transporting ATPase subunit b
LEALGINLGYLIVQIFNFAILIVVLRAWVYKPVLGLLDKRRKAIAQGLEDARIVAEARENAEQEAKEIIAEAQANAAQKVRDATERAETSAREIQVQAEADAMKTRETAVAEAEQEKERILSELRGQIASLSIAAAQKLVGEAMDENRQRSLIEEFFSGVKSGKVTVLEGSTIEGGSAIVTSALPLTAEEQDKVKKDVLSKLGGQATVSFRVDPNILGGLIIRIGDKVLDGSVAGQFESLRQSLH